MRKTHITVLLVFAAIIYALPGCNNKVPDHQINLSNAVEKVNNYDNLLRNGNNPQRDLNRIQSFYYNAETFTKKDIEILLAEPGCEGMRVYRALDSGRSIVLFVGVNSKGEELLPDSSNSRLAGALYDPHNHVLEADPTLRCPDMCYLGLSSYKPDSTSSSTLRINSSGMQPTDSTKRLQRSSNTNPDSLKKP